MAGVYISGIEMPINVDGCEVIIRIQPDGEVLDLHGFHIGATAIPVPDHSDLIERNAVLHTFTPHMNRTLHYTTIRDKVPTILSADKEELK